MYPSPTTSMHAQLMRPTKHLFVWLEVLLEQFGLIIIILCILGFELATFWLCS